MTKAVDQLVSVILISDNQDPSLVHLTMDSLKEQTLSKDEFEIILVEKESSPYTELLHSSLESAKGEFVVIIKAGDKIDSEYLKRSVLVLRSHKGIGFTYTSVKKFGLSEGVTLAQEFNARKFAFYNLIVGAVYRADVLREASRSLTEVSDLSKDVIHHFLNNKVMALGYWGKPVNDSMYFLYTDFSISNLPRRILNYETLHMLRALGLKLLLISRAQKNYSRYIAHGTVNDVSYPRPLQRVFGFIFSRLFTVNVKYIPWRVVYNFIFFWGTFKNDYLNRTNIPSEAELIGRFQEKPDYQEFLPADQLSLKDTVIFAHDAWVLGGGEKVLLKWIRSIVSDDRTVKIIDVACRSNGDEAFMRRDFRDFSNEQYALDKLSQTPKQSLRICWDLIKTERPKLLFIMSNSYFYALTPHIKKHFPDIVIVDLLHNEYADDPGWFSISDDYKQYLDHRIVLSETWKNVLIGKYGQKAEQIIVCENGVDLEKYDPGRFNKNELKKQYGLSSEKMIVTFIGRINRQKNPEVFLELAKSLTSNARFEFLFVGNKDDHSEYVQGIEFRINGSSNIRYLGSSDQVPQILAMSDVLILPSKFEGDPLISLEAAAMNVPIIATDIVGFRKQVQEGRFGILYELKDEAADARMIKSILLNRQDEIRSCAIRGREFIKRSRDLRHKEIFYKETLSAFLKKKEIG